MSHPGWMQIRPTALWDFDSFEHQEFANRKASGAPDDAPTYGFRVRQSSPSPRFRSTGSRTFEGWATTKLCRQIRCYLGQGEWPFT